jgi:hypothetical protein
MSFDVRSASKIKIAAEVEDDAAIVSSMITRAVLQANRVDSEILSKK